MSERFCLLVLALISSLSGIGCGGDGDAPAFDGDPRLVGLWIPAEPDAARGMPAHAFLLFSGSGRLEQFTGREGIQGTYRVDGPSLVFALGADHESVRFGWEIEQEELTLTSASKTRAWRGTFRREAQPASLAQGRSRLGALVKRFVAELERRAHARAESFSPGIAVEIGSHVETHFGQALALVNVEVSATEHDGARHPIRLQCTFVCRSRAWSLVRARRSAGEGVHADWRDLLAPDDQGRVIMHADAGDFARLVGGAWQVAVDAR